MKNNKSEHKEYENLYDTTMLNEPWSMISVRKGKEDLPERIKVTLPKWVIRNIEEDQYDFGSRTKGEFYNRIIRQYTRNFISNMKAVNEAIGNRINDYVQVVCNPFLTEYSKLTNKDKPSIPENSREKEVAIYGIKSIVDNYSDSFTGERRRDKDSEPYTFSPTYESVNELIALSNYEYGYPAKDKSTGVQRTCVPVSEGGFTPILYRLFVTYASLSKPERELIMMDSNDRKELEESVKANKEKLDKGETATDILQFIHQSRYKGTSATRRVVPYAIVPDSRLRSMRLIGILSNNGKNRIVTMQLRDISGISRMTRLDNEPSINLTTASILDEIIENGSEYVPTEAEIKKKDRYLIKLNGEGMTIFNNILTGRPKYSLLMCRVDYKDVDRNKEKIELYSSDFTNSQYTDLPYFEAYQNAERQILDLLSDGKKIIGKESAVIFNEKKANELMNPHYISSLFRQENMRVDEITYYLELSSYEFQFMAYVRKFDEGITVMEPEQTRKKIISIYKKMLANYKDRNTEQSQTIDRDR